MQTSRCWNGAAWYDFTKAWYCATVTSVASMRKLSVPVTTFTGGSPGGTLPPSGPASVPASPPLPPEPEVLLLLAVVLVTRLPVVALTLARELLDPEPPAP